MKLNETALTVEQLNNYAKALLENDERLHSVRVQGELSGFKRHSSGHLYFTLKDEAAAISCVMFRSSAASLRFSPSDGLRVVVTGSVSIFVKDGKYQLYVNTMREAGEGELYRRFLELKDKLEREGLFERKRPIPFLPKCVGIVTSETGAALHDILTVTKRRFPMMNVLFAPAQVQGPTAPQSMIDAIRLQEKCGKADVLIVGRGGGSYDDLSCFNDEALARAIFASPIPVISAVGHEVDFTIADFAADMRAPTPSAAAELAVPEYEALRSGIADMRFKMDQIARQGLSNAEKQLALLRSSAALSKPATLIDKKRSDLRQLIVSMENSIQAAMAAAYAKTDTLTEKMKALNPFAVLARGYAIVRNEHGEPVVNAAAVAAGDRLELTLSGGRVAAKAESVELTEKE